MDQIRNRKERIGPRTRRLAFFAVPLALYASVAWPLGLHHKECLFGDAMFYIRRTMCLAQGDFYHSISGYWSPLISWCMTPLVWAGMDGLYAGRLVICLWGALFVMAFGLWLRSVAPFAWIWQLLVLSVVALSTAVVAGARVTPDILMTTCLVTYLAAVGHAGFLERRRLQFAAGIVAGLAYLAKAYAFPFVLVHLPMTLAIRAWASWRGRQDHGLWPLARRTLSAYALAMAGFVLLAGPWVGVLTWRYGHFTFSTSGSRAHAIVGPAGMPHWGLASVPDPYLTAWENPETVQYQFWSPFDSREHWMHQMAVIRKNLRLMGKTLTEFDALKLAPAGLILAMIGWVWIERGARWKLLWLLATMALYVAGYMPVYFASRYVWYLMVPMSLVASLWVVLHAGTRWPPVRAVVGALVLASFAAGAVIELRSLFNEPVPGAYRRLAQEILKLGLTGPIACSDRAHGRFMAMFTGEKYLGFPLEADAAVADRKLRESGVKILVISARAQARDPFEEQGARTAAEVLKLGGWKPAISRGRGRAEVYVPVRQDAPSPQQTPSP